MGWQRLFLQRVGREDGGYNMIWDEQQRSIGIDFGKRHQLTAPAKMTVTLALRHRSIISRQVF